MSTSKQKVSVFWFRRDLRLEDNAGLFHALSGEYPVLPLFIFDSEILEALKDKSDRRVTFIYNALSDIRNDLQSAGSDLMIKHGSPLTIWEQLLEEFDIRAVYTNHDYEPYALERDTAVEKMLSGKQISFHMFKDQVIFEKDDIMTDAGKPYTVYTPYRKRWQSRLKQSDLNAHPSEKMLQNCLKFQVDFPVLEAIGFQVSDLPFPAKIVDQEIISNYHERRDYPGVKGTTLLSVHLRFGTISTRKLVKIALSLNETWLSELIWREFFMSILWHFPHVVNAPFRAKYQKVPWRHDEDEFQRWCRGETGYPMVDAGMRELNATGFMHNRVRMVTASFLTKHLLIDWQWGEAYFAEKLLDFELASNNGNWQWAAGCGCDAAPYFRIFNPESQQKKFDPQFHYIKKWIPEFGSAKYPAPMIEHSYARQRALAAFKGALSEIKKGA